MKRRYHPMMMRKVMTISQYTYHHSPCLSWFLLFFPDDGSMYQEVEKQEGILTIGLVGKEVTENKFPRNPESDSRQSTKWF